MTMRFFVIISAVFYLAACGSGPQSVSHYFGEMEGLDYEYAGDNIQVLVNPEFDLSAYHFIKLNPLQVEYSYDSDLSKMDEGDVQKMQNYFKAKLEKALEPRFQSVEFLESGVLEVKAVIRNFTPDMPIASLLSRDVLKYRLELTDIRADLVFIDPDTGKTVLAILDSGLEDDMFRDKTYLAQWSDVHDGMDAWVRAIQAGVWAVASDYIPVVDTMPDVNTDMLQLPQQPVVQPTVWDHI